MGIKSSKDLCRARWFFGGNTGREMVLAYANYQILGDSLT